jgi:hypothetical protein
MLAQSPEEVLRRAPPAAESQPLASDLNRDAGCLSLAKKGLYTHGVPQAQPRGASLRGVRDVRGVRSADPAPVCPRAPISGSSARARTSARGRAFNFPHIPHLPQTRLARTKEMSRSNQVVKVLPLHHAPEAALAVCVFQFLESQHLGAEARSVLRLEDTAECVRKGLGRALQSGGDLPWQRLGEGRAVLVISLATSLAECGLSPKASSNTVRNASHSVASSSMSA